MNALLVKILVLLVLMMNLVILVILLNISYIKAYAILYVLQINTLILLNFHAANVTVNVPHVLAQHNMNV